MRQVVTFDAYGTLIDFQLGPTTLKILADCGWTWTTWTSMSSSTTSA